MTGGTAFPDLLSRYPVLRPCLPDILAARDLLISCYRGGGKVLACGNGGGAADADHLVAELMKGFLRPRPLPPETRLRLESTGGADGVFLAGILQGALPAISLGAHGALLSAFANDRAAEAAYAQQVLGYGTPGDVLVCFSTSGNSRNIILAARTAVALGLKILGLTGRDGGALAALCDIAVRVPEDETYRVQELHLPVYHALAAAVEEELLRVGF
jgi:D-sedoheptulose 7-phosphate isomerase